jgi:hypothetical protein
MKMWRGIFSRGIFRGGERRGTGLHHAHLLAAHPRRWKFIAGTDGSPAQTGL